MAQQHATTMAADIKLSGNLRSDGDRTYFEKARVRSGDGTHELTAGRSSVQVIGQSDKYYYALVTDIYRKGKGTASECCYSLRWYYRNDELTEKLSKKDQNLNKVGDG